MNFGQLLWKLKERATEFLLFVWEQDYSFLEKKFLGVSLLDLVAVLFAAFILYEILKWFVRLTGKMLGIFSQLLLYALFTVFLLALRKILSRALSTARYLWLAEKTTAFRQSLALRLQDQLWPSSKT